MDKPESVGSCPLCASADTHYFTRTRNRIYHYCENCSGIFLNIHDRLNETEEKKRYLKHNNDINDGKYRKFVSPIVDAVVSRHPASDKGLDFGAGTGSAAAAMLCELNYSVQLYDPFFNNDEHVLSRTYDFIICCEVMEHFYNPRTEFLRLLELLNDNGDLFCMTDIYTGDCDFEKWYYKDDPTHVFFYQKETILWIRSNLGFRNVEINDRVILLHK